MKIGSKMDCHSEAIWTIHPNLLRGIHSSSMAAVIFTRPSHRPCRHSCSSLFAVRFPASSRAHADVACKTPHKFCIEASTIIFTLQPQPTGKMLAMDTITQTEGREAAKAAAAERIAVLQSEIEARLSEIHELQELLMNDPPRAAPIGDADRHECQDGGDVLDRHVEPLKKLNSEGSGALPDTVYTASSSDSDESLTCDGTEAADTPRQGLLGRIFRRSSQETQESIDEHADEEESAAPSYADTAKSSIEQLEGKVSSQEDTIRYLNLKKEMVNLLNSTCALEDEVEALKATNLRLLIKSKTLKAEKRTVERRMSGMKSLLDVGRQESVSCDILM